MTTTNLIDRASTPLPPPAPPRLPDPDPGDPPPDAAVKSGWRTSEFLLTVAAHVLTVLYAGGIIPTSGMVATVVAIIATQLTSAGYAVLRTTLKRQAGAVVAVALLAAIAAVACSPGSVLRRDSALGIAGAARCEIAGLTAEDAHDAGVLAELTVSGWISGTVAGDVAGAKTKIAADLAPLKGKLWPCLFAGAVAAVGAPTPGTTTQALSSAADPGPTVRAAFQLAARELGWPLLSTSGGAL